MSLDVHSRHDVVVVGGGPAGVCAALAAARNGADVLLVEQQGFLGGHAVIGLALHTFHSASGEQVIRGIPREIIGRLRELGGTIGPVEIQHAHMRTTTPVDHELLKYLLMEMIAEAGVTVLLHTTLLDVVADGERLVGVVVHNKSGQQVILAEQFVDTTGDGDLAAAAGAPFEMGRPQDGLMQATTLLFKVGRVDLDRMVKACGTGWARGNEPQSGFDMVMWFAARLTPWNDLLQEAPAPLHPDYVFWGNTVRADEANINITRVTEVDGTNGDSLTRAEMEGRLQVMPVFWFLKDNVPGFEDSYVISSAPFLGVRETRRVTGEYVLTERDILRGRKFDDRVLRGAYPIDIHDAKGKGTTFQPVGGDGSYDIPYRCLVPLEVDNLLVAGRCISTTHEAQGSVRVIVTSMAMGQAAGTAAALCCRLGTAPRRLEVKMLQEELRKQGVDLGRP